MASRGLWHVMSARQRRSLALSWSALFVLSLLMQYFNFALAAPALAVHKEGLFELDGNAQNDPAVAGDDWNSHPGATGNRFTFINDKFNSSEDIGFTGGGSKDDLNTSSWAWIKDTVTPDKDDIEHAYAASYEHDGDTFVYFGLDKLAVNGDSNVGFWFFKNGIGTTDNGGFAPQHSVGDLLVLSQFTNGGDVSVIDLYEWVGSGGDTNGTLDLLATGNACTGSPLVDKACAVANTGPVPAPWSYHPKSGPDDIFPTASFFEGGINLDELFGGDAPCFSGFLADTRTSQSVDAVLKDVAVGEFNTCVPPSLVTDASVSTWHFGDAGVTDLATLSGTDGPASGKVKFFVCTPAEIDGTGCPAGVGTQIGAAAGVTVTTSANGGTATSSPAFVPTAIGKYCFRAEYVPDAASQYLAASHSNTTSECFTVVKNSPTITTSATEQVNAGQSISDSATLAGATSDASGSITFKAYGPNDADCSGTAAFTSSAQAVSGNGTYGPVSFTPTAAGTYRWIASYTGDAKNLSATGACNDADETDTVLKVNPTIATQASASVVVGGQISDTATVSGGTNPTGTVTFNLYGPDDATCANAAIFTSANRPLSGGSATSAAFTTTQAGTYRWRATYNGDANNNAVTGACNAANENVVVTKKSPSIATSLVGGGESGASITVTLGTSVRDTSTLTGATADAGGTVHYQVFDNPQCTGTAVDAGTKTVTNAVPGDSNAITFNTAGKFYWQADYSGDANNNAATSSCNLEVVTVAKNIPDITTTASATVLVGGSVSDTAHLSGGFNPTGTILFALYGPNDATCALSAAYTKVVTVDHGNGDYGSGSFTPSAPGTYRWIASYSGDAENAPVSGACNDANENVVVTTPNLHAVKTVAINDGAFGHDGQASPGDTLNYRIVVTNTGNGAATNVPVEDDIADLLAHADYNADCSNGCTLDGSTLKWTIASIAANGGSVTLTFSVTLDDTFPTGTTVLPNVVIVTGPGSNCPAQSQDPDCGTENTVSSSSLSIDKSLTGNSAGTDPDLNVPAAKVGDTLHYTLAYHGEGKLTGAVITDVLPKGLEYVVGSALGDSHFTFDSYNAGTRTLTWKAATLLDPEAAETNSVDGAVTYDVKVLSSAPGFAQPLTNVATIDSDQTEPDSDTASVAVLAPPLELTPPPTNTLAPETGTSNPGFALMLILFGVAGLALGIGFITPVPERVRRRDGR